MTRRLNAELAIDVRDAVGEGPAWDDAGQCLYWTDIVAGTLHVAKSDDQGVWTESKRWDLGRSTAAVLPRKKGGLVVVAGTEIMLMSETGEMTSFARLDVDPATFRLNDAKCDPQGRLWTGTHGNGFSQAVGALYRVDPDGTITKALDQVGLSNGSDWSPDGKTYYYIDSFARTVDAFDFDAVHGTIGNRRTIVHGHGGQSAPDGMCVDNEGGLWVAFPGTGEVRRYTPDGDLSICVEAPVPGVTSCAFGGRDGGTLFITSAAIRFPDEILPKVGLSAELADQSAAAPNAGALFVCRPGMTGKAATPFAG